MRLCLALVSIALLLASASALSSQGLRKSLRIQRSNQASSLAAADSYWPFGGDVNLEDELRTVVISVANKLIEVQKTAKSAQGESCERVAAFKWEPKVDQQAISHEIQGYCTIGSKGAVVKGLGGVQTYNTITTLTKWTVKGVTPSTMFLAGVPMKLLHVGISVGAKMYLTSLMKSMNKQADMLIFLSGIREANEQFPQTRTVKQLRAYDADTVLHNIRQQPDCVVDAARPHTLWLWSIANNLIEAYGKEDTRKLANKCIKLVSSELYTYAYAIQYSQFGAGYLDHSGSPGAATAELKSKGLTVKSVNCGPHSFSCCLNEYGRLNAYGGLLGNDAYAVVLNTLAHGLYDAAQGKYKPGLFKDKIQPCADFIKFNEAALRVPEPRTPPKATGADAKEELVPLTAIGLEGVAQPKEEKPTPAKSTVQLPAEEANKPVDEALPVTKQF